MIRFFADSDSIQDDIITLSTEDAEHVRSLRLRPDEQFIVCDGNETDYICTLAAQSEQTQAQIRSKQKTQAEPTVSCTMFLAYAKGDRLDTAIQKSVEIGAKKIVLFESARCISIPHNIEQKTERLRKIALEAAKQSGRGIIPDVTNARNYKSALDEACQEDLTLLCYEGEANLHIMTVLDHYFPSNIFIGKPRGKVNTAAVITGPEGGFEPAEIELAQSMNVSIATLGPRILRSETAPIVALSAIMYHTGNL